jgi:ATP-dependent Clp protease ATP-binding subunit ClpC
MVIDEEEIAEVLAQWTGIPVHRLTQEETARLLEMENELHKNYWTGRSNFSSF